MPNLLYIFLSISLYCYFILLFFIIILTYYYLGNYFPLDILFAFISLIISFFLHNILFCSMDLDVLHSFFATIFLFDIFLIFISFLLYNEQTHIQ